MGSGLDDLATFEEVRVFEQVALVGQDLLGPKRPLLVPRPREAERLVPGRKLNRAGTRVFAERDREHLEHDADHVVFGLLLGQPERVHLNAVAESTLLGVGDAVSLTCDPIPQLDERAHLAQLLDEADAGVDEEADTADDLAELAFRNASGRLHRVEHTDRGDQSVRELLRRGRAGFLQVIAADVDRIPLGDLVHRVRDQVGDEPHRRRGRKDVRAPREVLLDDVVLRRASEHVRVDALVLRGRDVERQQPDRGGVDRHRGVHLVERDTLEQLLHGAEVRNRDTDLADLAAGERVIGVVSGLGRQIEGHAQARLAFREVGSIELVRCGCRAVTRVGPHDPRSVTLPLAVLRHPPVLSSCSTRRGGEPTLFWLCLRLGPS